MKRKALLAAVSLGFMASAYPQTQSASQSFDDFRKGMLQDYSKFRKSVLEEYDKYLEGVWTRFESFKAEDKFSEPKPSKEPVADPNAKPLVNTVPTPEKPKKPFKTKKDPTPQPVVKPEPKPEVKPEPKPEVKPEPKPEVKPEPKPEVKPEPKPVVKPEPKPEVKPVPKPEVKPEPKPEVKPEPKPEVKPEPKPEVKPEPKPEVKPVPKPEVKPEPKPEVKPEPKPEVKPEPKPEVKPEPKPEVKPEPKPEVKPEPKPEVKPEPKPEVKPVPKPEVKPEPKPEVKPEPKPEVKPEPKPEVKPEPKPEVKPEPKPEVKPEPKPEVRPEPKPEVKPEPKPEVKPVPKPEVKPEPKPEVKPEPKPEVKPEPKPEPKPEVVDPRFSFPFYTMEIKIQDKEFPMNGKLKSSSDYAKGWRAFSTNDAKSLIPELKRIADDHKLNDYLTFEMVGAYVNHRYPDADQSLRALLRQYLLANMGYDVRIGVDGDSNPIMLVNLQQFVYGRSGIIIDNTKYYTFRADNSDILPNTPIYTYKLPSGADIGQPVDLILTELNLPPRMKDFKFSFGGIELKGQVNENIFPIVYRYPQMTMADYANSVISPGLRDDLVRQLKEQLKDMPKEKAVDLLLKFTQSAFEYQTDGALHGFEKPYFIEEMLYYPACDCEDRSIFYTYMLWNVLGVENHIIGYPGHESAAVNLSEPIQGTGYEYDGKYFYISDPTYIGSTSGMCMPRYQTTKPTIDHIYK